MKLLSSFVLVAQLLVNGKPQPGDIKPNHVDQSTYANFNQVASTHLSLDFTVDFETKQFDGNVVHTMDCHESSDRVVMDYVGIDIKSI